MTPLTGDAIQAALLDLAEQLARRRVQGRIYIPDYSWMGVWRMSGEDQIRALTRQYSYRPFPFRSGVEIHLSGERRVSPDNQVEQALHASMCGKPE